MATTTGDTSNRGIFALKYLVHLVAAVHFWFGIYYDFNYVYPPKSHPAYAPMTSFGGKFRYLTILGAVGIHLRKIDFKVFLINALSFSDLPSHLLHAVCAERLGWNEWKLPEETISITQPERLHFCCFRISTGNERGHFVLGHLCRRPRIDFAQIVFIILPRVSVQLTHPSCRIPLNRIAPKLSNSTKWIFIFSFSWLNHVMHTNIVVFVVLEMILTFRQYPNRKTGFTGLLVFNVAYLIWIHIIKYKSGRWVYPILDVLSLPQRLVFMLVIGVFGISFYFVGEFLNNKIWAKQLKPVNSGAKKHK